MAKQPAIKTTKDPSVQAEIISVVQRVRQGRVASAQLTGRVRGTIRTVFVEIAPGDSIGKVLEDFSSVEAWDDFAEQRKQ